MNIQFEKSFLIKSFFQRDPYNSLNSYKIRELEEKANRTFLPYDSSRGLYLEYENFNPSIIMTETNMQFMNYPFMLPMSYIEKKQLFDKYVPVKF